MNMYALPILASDAGDTELLAALVAGWTRRDLRWERLQEQGNICYDEGDLKGAAKAWRRAGWIALLFPKGDPRHVPTWANLALIDQSTGHATRAGKRYAKARQRWREIDNFIENMEVSRRARSSLFHMRMEALHWDTYQDNLRTRFRAFAAETATALENLAAGRPTECRLFGRWKGEKPSVYDDTRKFLSASLLDGGGAKQPKPQQQTSDETA